MAKRDIKFLVNDIKKATVAAARDACVEIMNSLAEKGPAWTGRYSSAWYALAPGQAPGEDRSTGKVYKYDLRNVPQSRFRENGQFTIVNGMSYASQAQDLTPFDPKRPLVDRPIKPIEGKGKRPEGGKRGELQPGRGNVRTAPLDWYLNYVNGGGLKVDLKTGAKRGFGKFTPRGFG